MKLSGSAAVALALSMTLPAAAKTWNLYEWMAIAPVVVAGEVRVDDQKFVEVRVDRVLRGDAAVGDVLRVDQRSANRERTAGTPRLELAKGSSYLLLLQRGGARGSGGDPIFELVRGPFGARVLGEGGPAVIDAAARMAAWQDRRSEDLLWQDLARALDDPNPLLVEVALDMFAKFHRANATVLPALRELLDSPRADFRANAAALAGRAAARAGESPAADDAIAALVAVARRDPILAVRVAATRALGDLNEATPIEALREIARTDPDQSVRYEAQRILLQRRAPASADAIDLPARAP